MKWKQIKNNSTRMLLYNAIGIMIGEILTISLNEYGYIAIAYPPPGSMIPIAAGNIEFITE